MSYCFFCVIRSINDLYWMTPGYKAQIKYGDLVKTLNNYNETKKIEADEGIKIPDLKYTDKQALILSQYLADRNK